ncbi:MAG: penicillin-binding transpeptidase domain-containing protein [Chloroflexia bacterium]
MGLDLGAAGLREYGRRFGYEREILFELPVRISRLEGDAGFLSDPIALANSAYGQGQLLATPLQVLLTSATIANGGVTPGPYLVNEVRTPSGAVVQRNNPDDLGRAVSPETAQLMIGIMVQTVENGSGRNARIEGVQVAGKTGTAQLGGELDPHAWFTAFAPADDPQVAVVVLVENGGEGSVVGADRVPDADGGTGSWAMSVGTRSIVERVVHPLQPDHAAIFKDMQHRHDARPH